MVSEGFKEEVDLELTMNIHDFACAEFSPDRSGTGHSKL